MPVDDLIKTVMTELKAICRTETVVGQPVKAGETVIIPVSKVSVGFGAGGGDGKEGSSGNSGSGSGTGGGASIDPVAFIVVTPEGKAQLLPLTQKEVTVAKIIDMIPDVLAKFGFDCGNKKAEKSENLNTSSDEDESEEETV